MLKACVKQWDKNKGRLEQVFRRVSGWNNCTYRQLVEVLVRFVLNDNDQYDWEGWDYTRITEIDNGGYCGTLIYLIPANDSEPSEYDYLMTYVRYGSCSGCDSLKRIQEAAADDTLLLTETQVKDMMTLCKDLLTNMIKPYNGGWRHDEEYEEVREDV